MPVRLSLLLPLRQAYLLPCYTAPRSSGFYRYLASPRRPARSTTSLYYSRFEKCPSAEGIQLLGWPKFDSNPPLILNPENSSPCPRLRHPVSVPALLISFSFARLNSCAPADSFSSIMPLLIN